MPAASLAKRQAIFERKRGAPIPDASAAGLRESGAVRYGAIERRVRPCVRQRLAGTVPVREKENRALLNAFAELRAHFAWVRSFALTIRFAGFYAKPAPVPVVVS